MHGNKEGKGEPPRQPTTTIRSFRAAICSYCSAENLLFYTAEYLLLFKVYFICLCVIGFVCEKFYYGYSPRSALASATNPLGERSGTRVLWPTRQNSLQQERETHSPHGTSPNSAPQVVWFIFFFWSCLVLTHEGAFIQATDY